MTRAVLLVVAVLSWLPSPASGAEAPDKLGAGFLRQHAETRGFKLGRPTLAQPTPDGKAVLFLRSAAREPTQSLYELDVASGQTRELLTPARLLNGAGEQLSPEEHARRERMRVTSTGFTSFTVSDDSARVLVSLSGQLYVYERKSGAVRALAAGLDPQLSPDGKRVAFVRDNDLYVFELASGKQTRLTHSPHPRVSNGLAEFVAQEEMARMHGFWWSPDSRQLAFEEADSRPVETFHLLDVTHPEHEAEATPYPRPGSANALVRLGVISVNGGKPTWIKWDSNRFPYLCTVVWDQGGPLTLAVESRDQRDLELYTAEPRSGAITRLLTEHDDAWLNLDQSVPRWLPDGSGFAWSSERSGQKQLELRDRKGALVRPLSSVSDGYDQLVDVDGAARVAWFSAASEPTDLQLVRVSLEGGAVTPITTGPGLHEAVFGKNHQLYALQTSTPDALPRTIVHTLDRVIGELPNIGETPPFAPNVEYTTILPEGFRAQIVRPRAYQPHRKYPVIVDVYGGPQVHHVQRTFAGALFDQWYADRGFIVVSIDGRGTPDRGRAWERALASNLAGVTLDDQVTALKALGAKYPELDLSRVGIVGWSFGGYLAALAVLKRPDVFHVGVAGAPVVDWRDYDTFYTERYLGLPDANPEAYRQSSLLTWAPKLERPLLIVHGTRDDNVYFFHSLKLCEALFRAHRPFELLPLPGLTHMVPDPLVKEALYTRILGTLTNELKP